MYSDRDDNLHFIENISESGSPRPGLEANCYLEGLRLIGLKNFKKLEVRLKMPFETVRNCSLVLG